MNKIVNSILGFSIGDALGVPYEFKERNSFKCTGMIKSRKDSYHGALPKGTWSDDTSLMLCVLDSLRGKTEEEQYEIFRKNAIGWKEEGEFTATGVVFDIGTSCNLGIAYMKYRSENKSAMDITSNGNGGLMRVLPLCFLKYKDNEELLKKVEIFNSCSHNHIISNVGCLIYILLAKELLKVNKLESALKEVINNIEDKYKIPEYKNIWTLEILNKNENEIKSSGYVVDTLESCIYSLNNSSSYKEAIIKAVNLGGDTDTIGALTGGLASLNYSIPLIYKLNLKRRKEIVQLSRYDFINDLNLF